MDDFKKNFQFYIQAVFILSLILSSCYLVGYWWAFDINIFPFLTLFDLIKSASPFFVLFILLLIFQWIIMEVHFDTFFEKHIKKFGAYISKSKQKKRVFCAVIVIYFLFIILLGVCLRRTSLSMGIPIASAIFLMWFYNKVKKSPPEEELRIYHKYGRWLLFLCFLVFVSYDLGNHKAHTILSEKEYSYAWLNEKDGKKNLYKFIGFINGHYFFIDKNNTILLIKNNISELELHQYLKEKENHSSEIDFT